jgi:anti-sigma factor RsiW
MTCAELEILLCDYVDGTLRAEEKTALENHLSGCAACKQLAEDVTGVTAFFERVPQAEPPAELLTRILHHAPMGPGAIAERLPSDPRPSWGKRLFGGLVQGGFVQRVAAAPLRDGDGDDHPVVLHAGALRAHRAEAVAAIGFGSGKSLARD